jgi:hypothetical protein
MVKVVPAPAKSGRLVNGRSRKPGARPKPINAAAAPIVIRLSTRSIMIRSRVSPRPSRPEQDKLVRIGMMYYVVPGSGAGSVES